MFLGRDLTTSATGFRKLLLVWILERRSWDRMVEGGRSGRIHFVVAAFVKECVFGEVLRTRRLLRFVD